MHLSPIGYEDYLESNHWKHLRLQVLRPDEICKTCKTRPAEHAHHRVYKNLYDVLPEDLIAVCQPCHSLIHQLIDSGHLRPSASAHEIRKRAKCIAKERRLLKPSKKAIGSVISQDMANKLGQPDIANKRIPHRQWRILFLKANNLPPDIPEKIPKLPKHLRPKQSLPKLSSAEKREIERLACARRKGLYLTSSPAQVRF